MNTSQDPLHNLPVVHLRRFKRRLTAWLSLLVVAILAMAAVIAWLLSPSGGPSFGNGRSGSSGVSGDGIAAEIVYESPEFTTVVPEGKSIADLGGWARVSPPGSDKVYAFSDTIGDTNIIVSQQRIPKQFEAEPDVKLREFAESYAANRVLPTSDDTTAYIGTSAKGPQSVLLIKNDLLILIKSSSIISDDSWVGYIASLK